MSVELVTGLQCRLCGKLYPKEASTSAPTISGRSKSPTITKPSPGRSTASDVANRPRTIWRYRELLPDRRRAHGRPARGRHAPVREPTAWPGPSASGSSTSRTTPSIIPTLSFKDRVVAVALSKAVELGFPHRRLRLDGQPGRQRRGQRRRRGTGVVRPHPRRAGTGQSPGGNDLRRQGDRRARATMTM